MEEYLQKLHININFPFVLILAALIWARVLSAIVVIPFLFGKPVPRSVRMGASIVLTTFLYPIVAAQTLAPTEIDYLLLFALFFKEILIGLSIGFAAAMMFYGFEAAGSMIDNQRGVSLARILIPELGEQSSITGNFLFQLFVVIFLTLGGHLFFLRAFFLSFQSLPLFLFPQSVEGLMPVLDFFMQMSGTILFVAIQIAAPVIIAVLVTDIILGVTNRFAPQINVWELGFNLRGYVGILLLFLSLHFVVQQMKHYTAKTRDNVTVTIELLKERPPPSPEPAETISPQELEQTHPVLQ
ncbi:MAG: type III secretion system export apparatus subunit SctT [Deltaproteobacteria bacterium]|nr:type III secretion system export apparatus subunit SctT [Deltaproteobacteria bacterium]